MTGIATRVYGNRFKIRERETSELNLRESRNCHEDVSYLLN